MFPNVGRHGLLYNCMGSRTKKILVGDSSRCFQCYGQRFVLIPCKRNVNRQLTGQRNASPHGPKRAQSSSPCFIHEQRTPARPNILKEPSLLRADSACAIYMNLFLIRAALLCNFAAMEVISAFIIE